MPASSPNNSRPSLAIFVAAVIVLVGLSAITAYEFSALSWHPAREEPALYSSYHLGRIVFSLILSLILVWALARPWLSEKSASVRPMARWEIQSSAAVTVLAALAVAILVWDPVLFGWFAREDNILEWLSALLVLIGAVFFAAACARQLKQPLGGLGTIFFRLLIPAGFAGLYFLIGMEEISWGQRILGFETPDGLAAQNWQGEFNLHNIHTDISELAYYLGTGLFFIIFPLAEPSVRHWKPVRYFAHFIPNRTVAAISAPMVFLSYGHWNLVPVQMLCMIGFLAMLTFAACASRQGWIGEARLFLALAVLIAVGQFLILIMGPQMTDIPDPTEFRELFISIGLFGFAGYYLFGTERQSNAA